jgi:hypothetical protein
MFHGKEIRPLGFSRRGDFIGERAASKVGPGGLTIGGRGQALGRAPCNVPEKSPFRNCLFFYFYFVHLHAFYHLSMFCENKIIIIIV